MQAHRRAKAPATDLGELRTLADLQQELSHIFPSIGSITWELRTNRDQYLSGGALFEISGRLMVDPKKFKRIALKIAACRIRSVSAATRRAQFPRSPGLAPAA